MNLSHVPQHWFWKVQGYYGVSVWIINVMHSPDEHSCVHISGINLKPYKIGVLSPTLFVILMNRVSRFGRCPVQGPGSNIPVFWHDLIQIFNTHRNISN